ncbi:MAG: MarR family winged helix-turn-helix transcriptional regulator [Alphaproteobacteria bacterium]|nr:MarR family winged helix-turn-helix transcriptional regulator [Alphaproteobacteria bacterium]
MLRIEIWVYTRNMNDTNCVCIKLRRASRAITKVYDDALAQAGINVTQFSQLNAIVRLESPTIGQLAEATHLDRSTLGRNVRVLVRMNLARYGPGADERTRVVSITEKGRRTLEIATPFWESAQDAMTKRLGGKRHQAFFALLSELEAIAP